MKRVTKFQKMLIEKHFEAKKTGQWDLNYVKTLAELKDAYFHGLTVKNSYETIESRYVSITSQLIASTDIFAHLTGAYKRDMTRGFKTIFETLKIS
jgi:hypothetical protein